jgi:hypothetical protein
MMVHRPISVNGRRSIHATVFAEEGARLAGERLALAAALLAPPSVGDELHVDLPREVDAELVLHPEHLPAGQRMLALLAELDLVPAARIEQALGTGRVSQAAQRRELGVGHRADRLAVVDVALGLARRGDDAHRAVAASRVVDGELREAEAHLVVDLRERREIEVRREVDEGSTEDAADPHARMVA